MTFRKRRLQVRRDNLVDIWLDVFSAAASVLFIVAAVSGALYIWL